MKFYKFTTYRNFQIELPDFPKDVILDLECDQGIVRATIFNGMMTVYSGYAWDGCSPKRKVNIKGINYCLGVWDGFIVEYPLQNHLPEHCQQLKYPSLVHDIFCQFWDKIKEYIDKNYIDDLFYKMAEASGFPFAKQYYWVIKYGTTIYTRGRIS